MAGGSGKRRRSTVSMKRFKWLLRPLSLRFNIYRLSTQRSTVLPFATLEVVVILKMKLNVMILMAFVQPFTPSKAASGPYLSWKLQVYFGTGTARRDIREHFC